MAKLSDTVEPDPGVDPVDVRNCLVESVNYAWRTNGRCSVSAEFLGWLIQEHDRLVELADALAVDNE